jgi:hypothetical protein
MHAGRTSEGFDLLSGIRVGDLPLVQSSKRPNRIVSRVQSIIEQHPDPQAPEDLSVMEALAGASKAGDRVQLNSRCLDTLGNWSERGLRPPPPELGGVQSEFCEFRELFPARLET